MAACRHDTFFVVDSCLIEIAEHFEALVVTLTDLRDVYASDVELVDRLDKARHRALRGAELAKAKTGGARD